MIVATQASGPRGDPVAIGRIIGNSFAVVAANPVVVLGTAFLLGALPGLVMSYFTTQVQTQITQQPDGLRDFALLTIASGLVGFVLTMLVQGALVRATVAHFDGRRAGFAEVLGAAARVLLPLIGLSILVAIAIGIGFLFFVIPAVLIYVGWSVASPALVEEGLGIGEALTRSRDLTRGARWKIFGLLLIILVVYWVIAGTLGYAAIVAGGNTETAARIAAGGLPIAWVATNALVSTLTTAFWSTTQSALYVELRDWKDGPSADRLVDVFA